ncbi:conserved hypothetical protein [Ricinus communis]|uniref:Uncharacterized protein n=1 Tax=Ricinus communis TaxID=3988 RepID=B9SD56_RICCO|nr:conserved hypothetical protein [Ricinus communis]
MEYEFKNTPQGQQVRIPPPRGQIKAKIFKNLAKLVKSVVSVVGVVKKKKKKTDGDNGDSDAAS